MAVRPHSRKKKVGEGTAEVKKGVALGAEKPASEQRPDEEKKDDAAKEQ